MDPTSRPHNENREASAAHPSAPRLASLPASEYMRDLANQLVVQSRRDELLKEIQANPSADEPRLTYAAYLESHPFNLRDKARAELIRLQVARGDGEATPREREILIKHERDWMRELGQVRSIVWDRGFVDSVTMSPRSFAQAHETLSREPITELRVSLVGGSDEAGVDLRAALQSPHFQSIQKLTFWLAGTSALIAIENLVGANTPNLREIHFERCPDSIQEILAECTRIHYPHGLGPLPPDSLSIGQVAVTFGSFR